MSDREVQFYIVANFRTGRKVDLNKLKTLSKYDKIRVNAIKNGGLSVYLAKLGFEIDYNKKEKLSEYDKYVMSRKRRIAI